MIVAPADRAASTTRSVLASMSVLSITVSTAPWSTPPSEVKSFWYSMSTTAVLAGSIGIGMSSSGLCLSLRPASLGMRVGW
jgi:hypothetical protein